MTDMLKKNASIQGLCLAIDTSTSSLTVAVLENGNLLGEVNTYADRNHSIGLLPNIQELLASLGVKPKKLRAIAIGTGPGSYTGVRIGVTAAKTFAWSLGLNLIGVSSLEAMAFGGERLISADETGLHAKQALSQNNSDESSSKWYIPLMDARRSQAFTAIYESRGVWNPWEEQGAIFDIEEHWRTFLPDGIRVMEPWLEQISNLADDAQLRRSVTGLVEWGAPEHIVFVGETEGYAAVLSQFAEEWSGTVSVIPHLIKAQDLGLLAYPHWAKGDFREVHTLVPNYTQLPEAEAKLQAKEQKGEV